MSLQLLQMILSLSLNDHDHDHDHDHDQGDDHADKLLIYPHIPGDHADKYIGSIHKSVFNVFVHSTQSTLLKVDNLILRICTNENENENNLEFVHLHLDGDSRDANADANSITKAIEEKILIPLRDTPDEDLVLLDNLTRHIAQLLKRGWRGERFPVYSNSGESLFEVERAAAGLFGIRTFGCHMNGYVKDVATNSIRMWIAKRALSKQTHPGMLDNMAAGGIAAGYTVFDTMVKEAYEEAGIPQDLAKKHLKHVGCISYYQIRDGGIESEPGTEYCFDLCLPASFTPIAVDGEVDSFLLLDLDKVLCLILQGNFKAVSMLVVVDFMIRHAFLTPANSPCYVEICAALRVPSVSRLPSRPMCGDSLI